MDNRRTEYSAPGIKEISEKGEVGVISRITGGQSILRLVFKEISEKGEFGVISMKGGY